MADIALMTPSLLECHSLPALAADNLEAVRAAFQGTNSQVLQQAWLAKPEEDFTPGIVRVGWRGNSLLVFAELEDANIFTHATADNQRMWELGDTFEMFLQAADSPGYAEFHVTPNNFHLQLRFPTAKPCTARGRRTCLMSSCCKAQFFTHGRGWKHASGLFMRRFPPLLFAVWTGRWWEHNGAFHSAATIIFADGMSQLFLPLRRTPRRIFTGGRSGGRCILFRVRKGTQFEIRKIMFCPDRARRRRGRRCAVFCFERF